MSGGITGGKSEGESESATQVQIPDFLRPLVTGQADVGATALQELQQQLAQGGAQSLVAPFTQDQLAGFGQARDVATGGGGFIPAAQQQFLDTAQGNAIDAPGFQGAFEAALRRAQPNISSAFSLAGRSGSGLEATAQTQAAADAFASLFNQERGRQLQAAGALPGIATAGSNILRDIGGQQQGLFQRQLSAPASLFSSLGGGVPLQSLLGQNQQQEAQTRDVGFELGFGDTGA